MGSSSKLFKSSTALHCNQFRVDSMKFIPVFCFAIISFHAETKQLNGKTNEIQSEIQRSERNLQVLSHLTALESQLGEADDRKADIKEASDDKGDETEGRQSCLYEENCYKSGYWGGLVCDCQECCPPSNCNLPWNWQKWTC